MTLILKNFVLTPIAIIVRFIAINKIRRYKNKRVFIFDIDNTIADSIPSFNVKKWKSESERVATLAVFVKMNRLINILYNNPNNKIFFLTARGYFSYNATIKWLKSLNFPVGKYDVFITRTAHEKVNILKKVVSTKNNIYYIDDLSYINNDGSLITYADIISKLNIMHTKKIIHFFDIRKINQFINSEKSI
jgi:hypothetical protein